MPTNPFDQFDAPASNPFDQFDTPVAGSTFKSGSAFEDTKNLLMKPTEGESAIDEFKRMWKTDKAAAIELPIARALSAALHANPARPVMEGQDKHDKEASSAAVDILGALPSMLAGGLHGVGAAIKDGSATSGLKTAQETMHKLTPSTLLGREEDQKGDLYNTMMAPYTAIMDTMNAVPQGYGEILHAAGKDDAAAQLADGGKLAIMVAASAMGAREIAKGHRKLDTSHAEKLAGGNVFDQFDKQSSAFDRGVPGDRPGVQGELWSQEHDTPTKPIATEGQGELFGEPPAPEGTINYEKTSPFDLVPKDEPAPQSQMGLNMPEHDPSMILQPDSNFVKLGENTWEGKVGSRDAARAKAAEKAAWDQHVEQERARIEQEKEHAQSQQERDAAASKESDLNQMQAQKELDFAAEAERIQNSPARNFFTDPLNRDKLDLHDITGDHSFAGENLGDKTLMHPEATHSMVEALHKGDIHGALDSIVQNHIDPAYRHLAEYLKGVIGDVKVHMHDEGILSIGDRHATGYYDPATHTVGLSKVGAVSPHTLMHELVHSITSAFVNERPGDLRVMGLKDLFTKLNEMGMAKEFPEVHNIKEFLAEAFSNHEFQDYLKEHKLHTRSAFSRFMDGVKSILGISSSTRIGVVNALDHVMDLGKQIAEVKNDPSAPLKDAGVPGKLADLMVVRDKPKASTTPNVSKIGVPALKDAISDFKMEDRPIHEVINEARDGMDIPNTTIEKLSHQLQGGGLFESLKTRNPVVKAVHSRITRATQEFARDVKLHLTDAETGLKSYMRALTPDEKGQVHNAMILSEGKRELTNMEMRNAGMNDKQIAYHNKYREVSKQFFDKINARREELGMRPLDHRVAHMAGRFMGDHARFMFDKDGKIIGRIAGNTIWELNKATKFMQEKHPEAVMGKLEYNRLGAGKGHADRFGGLMEALNFLTKTDADVSRVMDSYKEYLQKDAIGYLNAVRHAKAKVKDAGGIKGSEGNKPWLEARKNAEQGMKAQLAYFEQGYKWMAMEKAVSELKPLLGDKEVVRQMPNAVQWGQAYLNHALGTDQGKIADAANLTASLIGEYTGIGHTNIFKANALVKHAVMQKFMGLGNIPFSITQLMQPFQVHPPMMALLKSRGLEINPTIASIKAAQTHLNLVSKEGTGKHSEFERAALDYANHTGIIDVAMSDHSKDINVSKVGEAYSTLADMNIEIPEKLTRRTSFLFYAHLLKDAGVPVKDIFGAAENLTNFTMVNYHPIERPMGYAKLGWLGDLASSLTRYKHNQWSQAAFYTREGVRSGTAKGYTPLATFLATSLAMGGVMGFFGYQEADAAYQMASKLAGKPDTLTSVLFRHNTPEVVTHGIFSTLGLDMTTRFSNANMLPDSMGQALIPYGSAVLDAAQNTAKLAMDPTSKTRWKQGIKSVAPQSVQGVLENQFFTHKTPDGKNLYVNSNDGPNFGKGRVYRDEKGMALRNFGFRDIRESKELAANYSNSQINKAKLDLAEGLLTKAKRDYMDGKLTNEKLAAYDKTAATEHDMDPNQFANEFVKWRIEHEKSQKDQMTMKNASGGFAGAMRIKEGR